MSLTAPTGVVIPKSVCHCVCVNNLAFALQKNILNVCLHARKVRKLKIKGFGGRLDIVSRSLCLPFEASSVYTPLSTIRIFGVVGLDFKKSPFSWYIQSPEPCV